MNVFMVSCVWKRSELIPRIFFPLRNKEMIDELHGLIFNGSRLEEVRNGISGQEEQELMLVGKLASICFKPLNLSSDAVVRVRLYWF
jgi:hypothetical protein